MVYRQIQTVVDNPLTQMANLPYSHRSGSMEEDLCLTRVLLTWQR